MHEVEKLFWLIMAVNLLGIALTLGALWTYSKSLHLLGIAIIKLHEKIKRLRQSIDSERQGRVNRGNPRNRP